MDWNTLTAVISAALLAAVFKGYFGLVLASHNDFISNIARGCALWSLAAILRFGHWDIAHSVMDWLDPTLWPAWRDWWGGVTYNVLPNCMKIFGTYFILKARLYLIPEKERDQYSWLTAVAYPNRKCLPFRAVEKWR